MLEMQETQVQSLGWEDPLQEGMATHSLLPGESLWPEEPGGLLSMGSQRVRHNWLSTHTERWSGSVKVVVLVRSWRRDACSLKWEQGVLVLVLSQHGLEWTHPMFIFCETVDICLGISWPSFTVLSRHYSPLSRAPLHSINIWRKHRNICWVSCEHNCTVWT